MSMPVHCVHASKLRKLATLLDIQYSEKPYPLRKSAHFYVYVSATNVCSKKNTPKRDIV